MQKNAIQNPAVPQNTPEAHAQDDNRLVQHMQADGIHPEDIQMMLTLVQKNRASKCGAPNHTGK